MRFNMQVNQYHIEFKSISLLTSRKSELQPRGWSVRADTPANRSVPAR
jgi:hypothetical protein